LFALRPSPLQTSLDALDDHRPFECTEDTEHLEHSLTRGGGRIDTLLVEEQIDP
jgi:hypothetical protein